MAAKDLEIGGNHYKSGKIDTIEYLYQANPVDGHGFCKGNIIKYASRLGLKGNTDDEIKDLLKIAHYALLILHYEYGKDYSIVEDKN